MFAPTVVLKGDYVGHPFRGNQWTDASGASRGLSSGDRADDVSGGGRVGVALTPTDDVAVAKATGRPYGPLNHQTFPPATRAALDAYLETARRYTSLLADERQGWQEANPNASASAFNERDTVEAVPALLDASLTFQIQQNYALYLVRLEMAKGLGLDAITSSELALHADGSGPYRLVEFRYDHTSRNEDGRLMHEAADVYNRFFNTFDEALHKVYFTEESNYTERRVGKPRGNDRSLYGSAIGDLRSKELKGTLNDTESKQLAAYNKIITDAGVPIVDNSIHIDTRSLVAKYVPDDQIGERLALLKRAAGDIVQKTAGYHEMRTDRFGDAQALDAQEDFVKDAAVSITMPAAKVAALLRDGRFKTQFESKRSGGLSNLQVRSQWEAAAMGIHPDVDPSMRPVYGMVEVGGVQLPRERGNTQYGDVLMVLKPAVRERTSFTDGDSLGQNINSVPLTSPRSARTLRVKGGRQYFEAQIRGGVQVSDIDYVVISGPVKTPMLNALKKAGIRVERRDAIAVDREQDFGKAAWVFIPTVLIKGDFVGHPFRGNQWVDASGSGRGAGSAVASKPRIKRIVGKPMSNATSRELLATSRSSWSNKDWATTSGYIIDPKVYVGVNSSLRGTDTSPESKANADAMVSAFTRNAVALPDDTVLYRGMRLLTKLSLKVGETFTAKGFQSTSTERDIAEGFASRQQYSEPRAEYGRPLPARMGVLLKMNVAKGTRVLPLTEDEYELVLPPNTTFVVTHVGKDGAIPVYTVQVGGG